MILAPGKPGSGREVIVVMKHKLSIISIAMVTIMLVSLCMVCASTSVSAADSGRPSASSANVQSGLVGAPAGIVGAPAVRAHRLPHEPTSLELFARGGDNALWWRHWNPDTTWGPWRSLGGGLTSSPSASSWVETYVYVRGNDGALWMIASVDGGTEASWSNWASLGGQLLEGTGPTARISDHGSTLDEATFVTGRDGAVWWHGGGSAWTSLGGKLTSSPAVALPGNGYIQVYGRGGDGALWSRWSNNRGSTWTSWYKPLGAGLLAGTSPSVCSADLNTQDLFVTGRNHELYWSHWDITTGYSAWKSRGGYLTTSPTADSRFTDTIDVFALGGDGHIWSTYTVNYGVDWRSWYEVAG
jgi:hypothetical protein